jgi:hypothetical protein
MSDVIRQDICSRVDGSTNFDRYRAGTATALRRQAMNDSTKLRTVCAGLLIIAGLLAVIFVVTAGPMPASRGAASMTQTEAPQTW